MNGSKGVWLIIFSCFFFAHINHFPIIASSWVQLNVSILGVIVSHPIEFTQQFGHRDQWGWRAGRGWRGIVLGIVKSDGKVLLRDPSFCVEGFEWDGLFWEVLAEVVLLGVRVGPQTGNEWKGVLGFPLVRERGIEPCIFWVWVNQVIFWGFHISWNYFYWEGAVVWLSVFLLHRFEKIGSCKISCLPSWTKVG